MEKKHLKRQIIFHLPHPPPARACPFTTLAFTRDVPGQTARCPPPRPRGACKMNKAVEGGNQSNRQM